MWRRIAWSLTACAPFVVCLTLLGQESSLERPYALLRGQGVRPDIVGNRLAVICNPSAHSRQFTAPGGDGNPQETLSIQLDDGHLRLRYESLAEGQLVLESCDVRQVRVQRHTLGKSVVYYQSDDGPVSLEVTTGGKVEKRLAAGLWQMLMFDALARQELVPVLELLRPQWRLLDQAQRVEQALLTEAGSAPIVERAKWERWLDQLASPDYATRSKANRLLRDTGVITLAWLERLESGSLDAEQRSHVLSLRADLLPSRADTPDLAAEWLVDDQRAWLALLSREDVAIRTLARTQLELLCRRTISFDPQADPSTRRQQIVQLQSRLGK